MRNLSYLAVLGLLAISCQFLDVRLTSQPTNNRVLRLTETGEIDVGSYHEYSDLRFLTFGTSRTWGSGLENRSLAYPYLLGDNVKNLAIRAAGPQVPSMCAYSMVGDFVADVIIFEYFYHADDYLVKLVRRMRHRFPQAVFIFLKIWSPHQFRLRYGERTSLRNLIAENIDSSNYTFQTFSDLLDRWDSDDWSYNTLDSAERALNIALEESNGLMIFPELDTEDPKSSLLKFGRMFQHDAVHFSAGGHRWIRDAIIHMIRSNGVERHNITNPWNYHDSCDNWFETGDVSSLEYDEMLQMKEFNKGKFALEMNHNSTSWLGVINKLDKPAEVFLSYMSMGPTKTSYPTVEVSVDGSLDFPRGVRIDALEYSPQYTYPIHLVQQTSLGRVKPGRTLISITEVKPGKDPFRIVGITVTQTKMYTKPLRRGLRK